MSIVERVPVRHEPSGVAAARHALCEWLVRHAVPVDHDTAALLASEIVTNAIVHGSSPASLEMAWDGIHLRVGVVDAEVGRLPRKGEPTKDAESGRGLYLIDRLADRWGVEVEHGVKTVWFELERRA